MPKIFVFLFIQTHLSFASSFCCSLIFPIFSFWFQIFQQNLFSELLLSLWFIVDLWYFLILLLGQQEAVEEFSPALSSRTRRTCRGTSPSRRWRLSTRTRNLQWKNSFTFMLYKIFFCKTTIKTVCLIVLHVQETELASTATELWLTTAILSISTRPPEPTITVTHFSNICFLETFVWKCLISLNQLLDKNNLNNLFFFNSY